MSFLAWVVPGLIAGSIGSKLLNRRGEGFFLDIILGFLFGAAFGACFFAASGSTGVSGLNLHSMFVAVVGAVLFLVIYHALVRRTA